MYYSRKQKENVFQKKGFFFFSNIKNILKISFHSYYFYYYYLTIYESEEIKKKVSFVDHLSENALYCIYFFIFAFHCMWNIKYAFVWITGAHSCQGIIFKYSQVKSVKTGWDLKF